MKKKIALIILCASVLTGCGSVQAEVVEETPSNVQATEEIITEEVTTEKVKSISEYKDCTAKVKNPLIVNFDGSITRNDIPNELNDTWYNVREAYEKSEAVVVGEVANITYCDEMGYATTYYDFAVSEVFKGENIEPESIITIGEGQGYLSIAKFVEREKTYGYEGYKDYSEEEKQNSYFEVHFCGDNFPQIGDKYVAFLQCQGTSDHIEGTYYLNTMAYMGKYVMNKEGMYERFVPKGCEGVFDVTNPETGEVTSEQPMTLDEMREIISNIAK